MNSVLGFHNNRKDFRFRSNFIFNILTENIITSPYDYLNVNFFETKYLGKNEFRQMLVDETITPKGLNVEDLCLERKKTSNLIARYDKREVQIKKVQEEVDFCISLLEGNGFDVADIKDKEVQEQVSLLRKMVAYVKNTVLRNEEDADNDLDHLKQGVMEDSINLHNLLSAKKQYEAYLGTLDRMEDALKPIEFLQKMKQEGFFTMWTDYIVSSLSKALSRIVDEKKQNALDALKFDEQINAVRMNIETKQKQIRQASALKQAIYQQAQSFRAIGVVEEKLKILNFNDDMKDKTFKLDNYDELVEKLEKLDSTIKEKEQANYTKWQTLDDEFQSIYDKFKYMEFYEGCKTKYNRESQRLQLRGKDEGYDYDVVGSQSNYMFLHLCFFLGFHKYLIDNVDSGVFQFLFIDQPSIPYYVGNVEVNSNDEEKLKDAFRVINEFMDYVVNVKKKQFQIILVEHAPETYWEGKNCLSYFHTCPKFLNGEALIPVRIIKKYSKND